MAKREQRQTGDFRPPEGWTVRVRVPWDAGTPPVALVDGRLVPPSFHLVVRPPEPEGAIITVVYEVIDGAVSNQVVATEGIEALRVGDLLRKAMPLDAWANWAVTYMQMQLLVQQLAKLDDPEMFASTLHVSEEEARRAIAAFKDTETFLGGAGAAATAAASSEEWTAAMATTRLQYETDGPGAILAPPPVRGAPRRNSVTKQHLQGVASVYRRAVEAGHPPTKAVAEHFGASHSTAARWVGMARSEKLLGPAKRGSSGEA